MKRTRISYSPAQSITIKAEENLSQFTFVNAEGKPCEDDQKSVSVAEIDWLKGDAASIVSLGTIAVATTTTINLGDNVAAALGGKAKPAAPTSAVNGRALSACTGEGYVKILIVP
ncbi:MAG: hypothetical protein ACM3U1_04450 [Chloroflexota bacterium]